MFRLKQRGLAQGFPLPQVVVCDEQLGKPAPSLKPLPHVVDPVNLHQGDPRLIVQLPNKSVIVIGQQELPLYPQQQLPQTEMLPLGEAVLPHVLVVALGIVIGGIRNDL